MHMSCAVASVGIRKSRVKAELSDAQDTACTWKTVLQPGQQDDQYKCNIMLNISIKVPSLDT